MEEPGRGGARRAGLHSAPVDQVIAEFCPDRLGADFAAEPYVLYGDDHLMSHGDLVASGPSGARALALPRSARC